MDTVEKLTTYYRKLMDSVPKGIWFAPGRVNLIGEHTDYNDGFVLLFASEQRVPIATGHRGSDLIVMHAVDLSETVELPLSNLNPNSGGWMAHPIGILQAPRGAEHQMGTVSLALTSDVPLGAGLPNSTAIECVVMTTTCNLFGLETALMERAQLAQRTENVYVGAPIGLPDQIVSTLCHVGHRFFMDYYTFETIEAPLPLHEQGVEVLALDARTPHNHVNEEHGEYRVTCEQVVATLGIRTLRDVTSLDAALTRLPDGQMRKRVQRVITENDQTRAALEPAVKGDLTKIAPLLNESYASIHDDYETTVPTIDPAVETALTRGALGVRMTDGGFGGCIIVRCPAGRAEYIRSTIRNAFEEAGFLDPSWFTAVPSEGTGRLK